MKTFNTKKGFTLVELLVVISIVTLISSVVLGNVNQARYKARDLRRVMEMRQVQTALEFYYDANGRYPDSDFDGCGGWDVGNQTLPFMTVSNVSTLGNFMSRPPRDPIATGNCNGYNYYRYGAGNYNCPSQRGAYYVLMIRGMETTSGTYRGSPGWSCPDRDWQGEGNWVAGKFEN